MLNGNFILMVVTVLSFMGGYAFGILNRDSSTNKHIKSYKIMIGAMVLIFVLFALEVI